MSSARTSAPAPAPAPARAPSSPSPPPPRPTRERHLLAQLASDDYDQAASAFTTLYTSHWRKLLKSATSYGWVHDVSSAQCEEIAHDSIAALWFTREEPRTPPVAAFLRTVVKRRILNARRSAESDDRFLPEHYAQCGYTPAYDEEGKLIWSGPFADARLLRLELYETLAHILNSMTPQRRSVLLDTYCDELSVAESAALRGIAPATVKKLRQLGRQALIQELQSAGFTAAE